MSAVPTLPSPIGNAPTHQRSAQRQLDAHRAEHDAALMREAALSKALALRTAELAKRTFELATRNSEYGERIEHQSATMTC